MTAILLTFSLIFILFGGACVVFPKQIGIGFSKLGKAIWKTGTFGSTDMRWFYAEAPSLFRFLGVVFLVGGITIMAILSLSFSGPGVLYAMRESTSYLNQTYGDAGGKWSISATKESEDGSIVTITYRHGGKSGKLSGRWTGEKYVFTEKE